MEVVVINEDVVVDEDRVSAAPGESTHATIVDFPIQRILDRLVEGIVDVLPIAWAGVTLVADGSMPHYIAASDESARRVDRLQTEIGEGPSYEAFQTCRPVSLPDLVVDDRFPRYSRVGVEAGLAAVFSLPLFHGLDRFGTLDLYCDGPGTLDAADMVAAQALADIAAALLPTATARNASPESCDRFHHAMHDPLTGLPNRLLLQERLEHAALRAQRSHTYTALLFLELVEFVQVDDARGQDIGDQLLRAVAQRLTSLVRGGDTLSRLAGDEFVLLCEELGSVDDVPKVVERLLEQFVEPFELDGVDTVVHARIGVACVRPGDVVTSDLLERADLDMSSAQCDGAGATAIGSARTRSDFGEQRLANEVRRAMDAGQLEVAYQPIIRSTDDGVAAVEVLLRWAHPHRGPIPPLSMVEAAERSDLIVGIGTWVLERACRDHAGWMEGNPASSLDLAVNVSVRQLVTADFCSTVSAVLARAGMDPRSLVLELTESIAIEPSARISEVLVGLTELGVRLALDDFGTGYSALSYLSRLPIDIVKIDRSLIVDLDRPSGRIVVAAVSDLAHELGLEVIAEGIETRTQLEESVAVGCDYTQGYFHAHPMAAEHVAQLLTEYSVGGRSISTLR